MEEAKGIVEENPSPRIVVVAVPPTKRRSKTESLVVDALVMLKRFVEELKVKLDEAPREPLLLN